MRVSAYCRYPFFVGDNMKKDSILKLIYSALCLSLCIVLPFLTGQIPEIGNALSPMHIPVFICAFLCGAPYGMAVGIIAPVLRSALFTMPPMFPAAVVMSLELAVYGFVCGLLYKLLPKKIKYLYVSLIISMMVGRIAAGIFKTILLMSGAIKGFTFSVFITEYFVNAIPGIICHIVLVPILVIALNKAIKKTFV